ncbi:hypothetical protein CEG14_13300 [Bordetella genomosp. 1]|uniref:Uncharacterized protein n=1 Tax=Bordetella genomosp. 1 TaxID=1395607 RepID=A0A261SF36_9BORD|nr:hypothetical protein CEG14_13300 [Bordetella genomosp. 1]
MSEPIAVTGAPAGSHTAAGRYRLDLTGPASHLLTREAGRGDLVIGPASLGKKADLHVADDARLDWRAFEPFATPAGSPWPRHFRYHGNDEGFIAWSAGREIEQFTWVPTFAQRRRVDASGAGIRTLALQLDGLAGELELRLPPGIALSLTGDLSRIAVAGATPDTLMLHPSLGRRASQPAYTLPDLGPLQAVRSLWLYASPLGQPVSLREIARFSSLQSLALSGNFTDWDAIAGLSQLQGLEIRYCPDLDGLPALDTWPLLERFIAFNVDEAAGKRLSAQLKARAKVRAWQDYASVSKLRKPAWWESEYGRPFGGWSARAAKAANAAYDSALETLRQARSADEVRAAIVVFSRHFNDMKGIETAERDDVGEAVWQFSQLEHVAGLGVTEEQALQWFDESRDY